MTSQGNNVVEPTMNMFDKGKGIFKFIHNLVKQQDPITIIKDNQSFSLSS